MDKQELELHKSLAVAMQAQALANSATDTILHGLLHVLNTRDPEIISELSGTLQGVIDYLEGEGKDTSAERVALEKVRNVY